MRLERQTRPWLFARMANSPLPSAFNILQGAEWDEKEGN